MLFRSTDESCKVDEECSGEDCVDESASLDEKRGVSYTIMYGDTSDFASNAKSVIKELEKYYLKDNDSPVIVYRNNTKVGSGKSKEEVQALIDKLSLDESLTEGFNEVEIKTDDQKLEMTSDENGKVTVTTEPLEEEDFNADWYERESLVDEPDETPEQEEIVPLTDEDAAEIEAQSEESEEEPAEEVAGEDEEEEEFDEFDEESFDQMGESYARKVYDNIKSYKTTAVNETKDTLIVEGLITFNSGNTKKTTFTFSNPRMLKGDKVVLEGYNKTFTKTKKAFSLKGRIEDKKFITESLGYHYIAKKLNESVRVNGRVKRVLV